MSEVISSFRSLRAGSQVFALLIVCSARRARTCQIIHSQSSLTYDMAVNYVVNELLAFVFFKYNADNMKDLETLICNFYGEEDVSEAKTLIHQYYETVIGPRPGRQNRGTKTLKQKEVSDILDAMKKLDESGPERPIIFVAINLINLPPISQIHQISTTIPLNLAHNVSNLETQVSELMAGQQQLMEMMKNVHVVSDKQAPHKEDSQQTLAPHPEVEQVKQTFAAAVSVPTAPMDISRDQKRTHEWVKVSTQP